MGISQRELKREINLVEKLASKSLKSLQDKNLVRLVPNFQSKGIKHYIATEFNPSTEVTGGAWYTDGSLDADFIGVLKAACLKFIPNLKVATLEGFVEAIKKSRVSQVELSKKQIEELVESLVCDNELMKVKSTRTGEFASIPVGKVCYKCIDKGNRVTGAMASIPCGVCPQLSICTPDGMVSPETCVYYNTCSTMLTLRHDGDFAASGIQEHYEKLSSHLYHCLCEKTIKFNFRLFGKLLVLRVYIP